MGVPGLHRPAIDQPNIRLDRARNLLAILLRHPLLLPEVEEPLMALDLPEGDCQACEPHCSVGLAGPNSLTRQPGAPPRPGRDGECRHLGHPGPGLCAAAQPAAQPKEALDGWWHFFGLLRGEAELVEDRAEAQRLLVETNDPAAQQRLIRLSEALAVLRGGEADATPEDGTIRASAGPPGHRVRTP